MDTVLQKKWKLFLFPDFVLFLFKGQPGILLRFCSFIFQFQPGIAYKSAAYKKGCTSFKFLAVLIELSIFYLYLKSTYKIVNCFLNKL